MAGYTNTERLALFTQLRAFESDFDKSQSQIRAICAAWSGVVLGALALLVTNAVNPPAGTADPAARAEVLAVLRCAICLIGSAGVYAFWFIDQRIYQRLLHSVFAYGLYTEFCNEDLPQLRSGMFIANLDVTNGLAWFYRTQFFVFLAISILFLGDEWIRATAALSASKATWIALALVVAHVGFVAVGERYSWRWSTLKDMAEATYPDLGAAMPVPDRSGGAPRLFDLRLLFSTAARSLPPDNAERRRRWLARVRSAPVPLKPDPAP